MIRIKPPLGAMLNLGHWLTDGLVRDYLLNEGDGRIRDCMNGTLLETSSSTAVWGGSEIGDAFVFSDGAADGIVGGVELPPLPINQGSFLAWISVDALTQNDGIITMHDGSNQNRLFMFYNSASAPSNQLQFNCNASGVGTIMWYTNTIPGLTAGKMHLIGANWDLDTDEVNMYIDGFKLTPDATLASGVPTGIDQVSLGCFHAANVFTLDGKIGGARIYNKILIDNEMEHAYEEYFNCYSIDPIELWSAASPAPVAADEGGAQYVKPSVYGTMTFNTGIARAG